MMNYWDYFYVYGIKQYFYINYSIRYHTKFSEILAYISYILLLFFIFFFGKSLFIKKNPSLNQIEINNYSPENINLSEKKFFLAFGIQNYNYTNYIDPSIYEVEATFIKITRDQKTQQENKSSKNFDLIECDKLNISIVKEFLTSLPLSRLYCINNSIDLIINGSFLMDYWSYIIINFKFCKGKNYCKDNETIYEFLKGGYFSIFTSNININLNNFKNPITIYGVNTYTSILPLMAKDIWFYIRNNEIITDSGLFFENKKKEEYYSFDEMKECTSDVIESNNNFLRLIIRASSRKFIYNRNYIKAGTVIADITAWSKVIFLIGEFICCFIDRIYYKHYLLSFFKYKEKNLNYNYFNKDINKKINSSYNDISSPKLYNFISKPKLNINFPFNNNFENKKVLINSTINKNNITLFMNNNIHSVNSSFRKSKKNNYKKYKYQKKLIPYNLFEKNSCWTYIKQIINEKKELKDNFYNISIFFDVIRYLKIFKDIHVMQKYIFDKNEKKNIELDYNLNMNPPFVTYIYSSKFKPLLTKSYETLI